MKSADREQTIMTIFSRWDCCNQSSIERQWLVARSSWLLSMDWPLAHAGDQCFGVGQCDVLTVSCWTSRVRTYLLCNCTSLNMPILLGCWGTRTRYVGRYTRCDDTREQNTICHKKLAVRRMSANATQKIYTYGTRIARIPTKRLAHWFSKKFIHTQFQRNKKKYKLKKVIVFVYCRIFRGKRNDWKKKITTENGWAVRTLIEYIWPDDVGPLLDPRRIMWPYDNRCR